MANTIGTALNSVSDPAQNVIVQMENDQILDFHAALEDIAHDTPLNNTIHGLTNTGESIGLGKVGETNIITDDAQAPGDILNGNDPGAVASGIVTDMANTVGDAGGIARGLVTDLSNPDFVPVLTDGTPTIVNDLSGALPGDGLGNVGDLGGLLNGATNGGTGGAGDSLVSIGAGNGGTPILDAGVLTAAPGDAPIGVAAGSGDNLLTADALSGDAPAGSGSNGGADSLVTAGAGDAGTPSILSAGALGGTNGDSPVDIAAGSGNNLLNVDALSGDVPGGNGSNGGADSLVTAGAGDAGTPSILSASALGGTNGDSPLDIAAGNGTNLADADLLGGNGSHLVSADGGAPGGNALLDTGVLTTPDGQSPVNADIGNGANIANASLLPNSDALSFPDLGGAGADSLTGIAPSTLGALDLAAAGNNGSVAPAGDMALADVHTDGSALVHINPDPDALVGVNDHAIV